MRAPVSSPAAHSVRTLGRRAAFVPLVVLVLGALATATAWFWPWQGLRAPIEREATVTVCLALTVLLVAAWFALRLRRRVLALVATVLLWWVAVETFAAPHLVHKLGLIQYFHAQDPDHWPEGRGPDWNADSLRGTPAPSEFTDETLNVLFLGDSFTFGLKVKSGEAFPALVGKDLKHALPDAPLRVANFGWSSSSPYLSYRRLLAIGARYHPDVVVLCVDMTDFGDDIRWRNLVEGRRIYWLYDKLPITLHYAQVLAPEAYERFVAWTVDAPARRFFHSEAPLDETRRHLEPLAENVADIAAWCRERGADFVLVALPRSYQCSDRESPNNYEASEYTVLGPYALEPFRFFDELRARVEYPVFSLLDAFRTTETFPTCFENDPHWLPAGHRVAADALTPMLVPIVTARLGR